ncbi:MAG: molybdopterin molybdotransferase MoeA [Elusimicrobia bacterium]|nr:molybdopterin molybdotransferase MoeA [Elusimicrobiota bacterium]
MIHPDEALKRVLEHAPTLGMERVPLSRAVERILAEDLFARYCLPPFDNSAMDGYAVRAQDLKDASRPNPVELTVREIVRAGASGRRELGPGEAARIMTGAPLPRGADSVVMQEMTSPGARGRVRIARTAEVGSHIRVRGEDVPVGGLLAQKGAMLRPYEIALLAAQGISKVAVIRRPRAAVLTTGDELVEHRRNPADGKIRDSNGPAILAALSRWNVRAAHLGIVRDDPKEIQSALASALSEADAVVVTGGVSVGDFDHTRAVFSRLGIREVFWAVAIKPGKPLLFGVREAPGAPPKLVFGLPGNPVAALVCLEEFIRPALEKLQGFSPGHQSYHLAGEAANDYPKPKDRRQYLFCRAQPGPSGYQLSIIRPQGSAMLGMAPRANALAVAPIGVSRVSRGDTLPFRWLK